MKDALEFDAVEARAETKINMMLDQLVK
jgi:hypothetical protein